MSRALGHSDLSTTADVYAHVTRAMQERSAARMDAILGPQREAATADGGQNGGQDPNKSPSGVSRRGFFVLRVLAGAPGFEPGTP